MDTGGYALLLEKLKIYARSKRFFLKTILIFSVIVIVMMVLIATYLTNRFYSFMRQDIVGAQEQIVTTYAIQFDNLHQSASMVSSTMLSSSDITNAFYGKARHPYDRFVIHTQIRNILVQFPFIDAISIIDTRKDFAYSSSLLADRWIAADKEAFFSGSQRLMVYRFVPRSVEFSANETRELMSMVIPFAYNRRSTDDAGLTSLAAGIVISVDADYFFGTEIDRTPSFNSNSLVLQDDTVLCASAAVDRDTLQALVSAAYPSLTQGTGSLSLSVENTRYLVSYHAGPLYTLLSFEDERTLFVNTSIYTSQVILVCLALTAVALLAIFLLARRTYHPINYIIESAVEDSGPTDVFSFANDEIEYLRLKFDEMQRHLKENSEKLRLSRPYIRNQLIAGLLNGNLPADYETLLPEYFPVFSQCSYFQIVSVFTYTGLPMDADSEQLEGAIHDQLDAKRLISTHFASMNGRVFILYEAPSFQQNFVNTHVLLGFHDASQGLNRGMLMPMLQVLTSHGHTVAIAVGPVVQPITALADSYGVIYAMERRRFTSGLNTILDDGQTESLPVSELIVQFDLEKLLKLLKSSQRKELLGEIENAFALMRHCSFDCAMLMVNTLFFHVLETATQIFKSLNEKDLPFNIDSCYEALIGLPTIDAVQQYLTEFIFMLLEKIHDLRSNSRYALYQLILRQIDDNLANPLLSLDLLGNTLDFSPGYISKVFAMFNEHTINEYINRHRIDFARHLLLSTQDSIADVGKKTGFQSSTYFITTFKKYVGTTPNSFRKRSTSEK